MSRDTQLKPVRREETFRFDESARLLTPALVIDRDRVQNNIAATLRLLGGDANRWRPHIKTAKLAYVMRMFLDAGVPQFKCATTLELKVACEIGARDILVAYPMVGANAKRVREIAAQHSDVKVSVLVESEQQAVQWLNSSVDLFIDVNPGMNRTGIPEGRNAEIMTLAKIITSSSSRLRGLHYYDGHLSKQAIAERCVEAHRGYQKLLGLVEDLSAAKIEVGEVITSGTPTFPCGISFSPFVGGPFIHRVSPGTVVYTDATSQKQLPEEYGYQTAAVVATRVVSQPAANIFTCDAGHKTVSADAGTPTCEVLGHPECTPLTPSEEHLPIRVEDGSVVPAIGELLYLVPRHICPTVNNFDHAVIVSQGKLVATELVSARGREFPIRP